ncbi:GNAT family N-acetyltransferase [Paenibacillus sp. GSMTC-2017]|uniref:GNAT family N-acetyltransferase n=1 Tax=Paenibacillus sp. GSMTC-2017 TaxID=2794350 RepID=UPI0018D8F149|nr:GNAT family N-acetyltransferase [Paenibacillus sp. GSMTC-2017]MBH5318958.1 GNAT family N-acetyltransferase [Paenibacillus sp. GSMTC-2017]
MNPITIVPYHPDLAGQVADMWNNSRDSWGDSNSISTAEQVKQEESSSDSLALYLAMDGEKVVGYCSLGEYREDTGALYIPLLNVRPDYHGKKVGRMLLDCALTKTIELGWPRLDLYTWAGNTKAVPLYKKFGFFWEDRDDCTHLMNMIPTVLRTEAIAHYFNELDWYQDSIRDIVIEPDGRKENEFDYFAYSWAKGSTKLCVEFERLGRGMRLIETDDYLISAEVEKMELVFGREYQILYRITNKSGKSLQLSLRGESSENIRFDYEHNVEVIGETTLTATFFVDEIKEEQSVWRTHPRVKTMLLINGKSALFQVGIVPKFPASLSLQVHGQTYIGQAAPLYLDVENNFAEDAEISFQLPSSSFLKLKENSYSLHMNAKQRISLPLSADLLQHGFYEADIVITAKRSDGSSVSFDKKIGAAFPGLGVMLSGETEQTWQIHNGRYTLSLNKDDNEITVSCGSGKSTNLSYPKLGKPFSSEFSKKRAEQVVFTQEQGAIGINVTYRSSSYPQIELMEKSLLFGDGTVEHVIEITNLSTNIAASELWLAQGFGHHLQRPILPYQGRYVEVPASYGSEYEYWDGELFSENWLFSRDEEGPWGICWPEEYLINFQYWNVSLETNLGTLEPRSSKKYGPIYLTHGGYPSWKEFRAFARKEALQADLSLTSHLELTANKRNPFVIADEVDIQVKEYKMQYLEGELIASLQNGASSKQSQLITEDEEKAESSFTISRCESSYDIVNVDGRFATHEIQLRTAIFPVGHGKVKMECTEEQGEQVFVADNGLIQIKAAPNFFSSLYSLVSNGQQWLASSFPKRQPKSWWNPWAGGVGNFIEELSAYSIVKEKREASFAELVDNRGNLWQGIKVSYSVQKQEKYRGLTCHQYFLLMPGVPVLCHTVQIVQHTGTYFAGKSWSTDIFLQAESNGDEVRLKTVGVSGEELNYKLGQGGLSVNEVSDYVISSPSRKEQLHIVTDQSAAELDVYSNKEVVCASVVRELNLPDNSVMFTPPVFFLFADKMIPADSLTELRALRFDDKGRTDNEDH